MSSMPRSPRHMRGLICSFPGAVWSGSFFRQSHRPLLARLAFSFPRIASLLARCRGNEKASAISCPDFVLHGDDQVELAGIEPASKQGNLRLSTCLAFY